jgi:hypothetical protein
MKPKELTFLTGIETSKSIPTDVITGNRITVTRENSSSRVPVSYAPDTDDSLTLSKSGYDSFISDKGITSTSPVILSIVPLRKESSEEAIITVQRGLAKTCVSSTTQMILDNTGSFTEAQATEFNSGFSLNFQDIVIDIFTAYKSKANYLSYLSDPLGVQVTDPVSYRYVAPYISYTSETATSEVSAQVAIGSVSTGVNYLSGFYETASTSEWVSSVLGVNNVVSRSSMTVLLQSVRNGFAKLAYDEFETNDALDDIRTLETIASESNDETTDFLSSIYQKTFNLRTGISEEHADRVFNKVAKELSLQSIMTDLNINTPINRYVDEKFGNITKLSYEQNIVNDKSGGTTFGGLLNVSSNGKIVQVIDPSAPSQDYLEQFITADQYYLIGPLANEDTAALTSRSDDFVAQVNECQDSLNEVKSVLDCEYDNLMITQLLECISSIIGDIFLTAYPVDFNARIWTMSKFLLLMKSTEDNNMLNILFRIMMLRDRLLNPSDYADGSFAVDEIKARAKSQIIGEINRLASKLGLEQSAIYNPDTGESKVVRGSYEDSSNTIEKNLDIFNFSIPGGTGRNINASSQELSADGISKVWIDNLLNPLQSEEKTQYDYFHTYAKNLESDSSITFGIDSFTTTSELLTGRVGITQQFIKTNRDHRAFALLLKTIFWFKNASTQNRDVLFRVNNASTVDTSSADIGDGDTSSDDTTATLTVTLEYNPSIWAEIKGIIDKMLSLSGDITNSQTDSSDKADGNYQIKIKLDASFDVLLSTITNEEIGLVIATSLGIAEDAVSALYVSEGSEYSVEITKSFSSNAAYLYNLNVSSIYDGNLRNIMSRSQTLYDVCNYISSWLSQAASLLNEASTNAANYTSRYGEKLATLYTGNSVTNLIRTYANGLKNSIEFPYYTSDFYRSSKFLSGMLNYADYALGVSEYEDSFVIVCGIPYGLIERMGGFEIGDEKNIKITLTFRDVNFGTPTNAELVYKFPAASFIDPSSQVYTEDQLTVVDLPTGNETILEATNLYYLTQDGTIQQDTFTDSDVKAQELSSTSILEYLRLLYGLDFSLNAFSQNENVNVDSAYPNTDSTATLLQNYVAGLKYDPLISSRFSTTIANSKGIQKKKIMKEALQGPVFDKIVAIPIDGSLLRGEGSFYMCDVMASIEFENVGEIVVVNDVNTFNLEDAISNFTESLNTGLSIRNIISPTGA